MKNLVKGGRERTPFFKINKMTKEEINLMIAENIQLNLDMNKLKKEQSEFQDALVEKINELKNLGPWRRFWGYWQLVLDLITTIEETIRKHK
tara:strand:+ start:167 stop:442 length:276 start_codon:yes stop_codon:yes gene_type:complete